MIILYILERHHIVLSIYKDYFILKPYSIGASCLINNDEIIEVKISKNFLIITAKNFKNPCRINLNIFNSESREEIIKYLESLTIRNE
jgi:hypothetical protein